MNTNLYTFAKRIMIIEDDAVTRTVLQRQLAHAGYEVYSAQSAEQALVTIGRYGLPHLAVIDVNLPGGSGAELCRQLYAAAALPTLIITAQANYDVALRALECCADDFVLKPFDMADLLARVARILRRTPSFDYAEALPLQVDDTLKVNLRQQQIEIEGKEVFLTPLESKLLSVLIRNANRAITQRVLLDTVWSDEDVSEDAVRVQIHRLRRKIRSKRGRPAYIQTERGVGYRFVVRDTHAMGFHYGA